MNSIFAKSTSGVSTKVKRFIVDVVLEPLIPLRRLESWLVFWARLAFRIHKPFIIGITGSVGKSTTTAVVAHVLSHRDATRIVGRVGNTFGNMNDDVGVSATLLRYDHVLELPWAYHRRLGMLFAIPIRALRTLLDDYPKVMVLECGAGWTGHLERVARIAPPDIAVVTRIGAAHLEKLKTLEGVVREKGALVRAAPSTGLVILGQGHDYVAQLEALARAPVLKVPGQGLELSQNIARAICGHMGVPDTAAEAALRDFKRPEGRLNRLEFPEMTIIDDTYNANPLSMQLALDALNDGALSRRRRVAVLGHMSELGAEAPRYHIELGAYARSRVDVLIGVGELAKLYDPDGLFDDSAACAAELESLLRPGDVVLVKGSASAKMSAIIRKLREIGSRRDESAVQS
jgi:UDP-N-acetylmuramoyl-tripeptide--D-alanyl-D-alanine ligase